MIFCDSHIHLTSCSSIPSFFSETYRSVNSSFSGKEFEKAEKISSTLKSNGNLVYSAFGIHPQMPEMTWADYLTDLAKNGRIDAIGEFGFDFFTPEFSAKKSEQIVCFEFQLNLAIEYQLPVILHGRKCTDMFFKYSRDLKRLPAVVFHSYAGTVTEARSFIEKGINGFFSFGKPLINGKKSAIDMIKNFNLDRILLETDAPYQTLKGEAETLPEDILRVYRKACDLRNISEEILSAQILRNFESIFPIRP